MEMTLINIETMTSTQFAEMTGREKKEINRIIRDDFSDEIVGGKITPTLRENGQVADYHLPETESIMLAAKLDKSYLRKISEFWKNRKQVQQPQTYEQIMQHALQLADERVKALESKIAQDRPHTEFGKAIAGSAASVKIGDWIKAINNEGSMKLGRNRVFQWLRDNSFLQKDNMPYQRYVDQGLFEVRESLVVTSKGTFPTFTTLLTGKGQEYFLIKLIGLDIANEL